MSNNHAQTFREYLSRYLIGICENKENLYKTVKDKEILNYSAIDIKALPSIFKDDTDEDLYLKFIEQVGKTIIGGFKLYGQKLIDDIGVINLKVYDQNKQFITDAPFKIVVDIATESIALQEIID